MFDARSEAQNLVKLSNERYSTDDAIAGHDISKRMVTEWKDLTKDQRNAIGAELPGSVIRDSSGDVIGLDLKHEFSEYAGSKTLEIILKDTGSAVAAETLQTGGYSPYSNRFWVLEYESGR